MGKKVVVVSAKKGSLSSDRAVINSSQATTTTAPSSVTDGILLNRVEYIHLLFKLDIPSSASCTFYLQLWWWSPVSEVWHKGERLAVNANDIHTVEIQGLTRLYLQIDGRSYSGSGTPSLSAWVGSVVPL